MRLRLRLRLARCTADLRAWTGLSRPQMQHPVAQLWEINPDTGRGRPWALPFADRVFLVVLAHRTNLTMQQLGSLFGISHAAAHRVIARLAKPLAQLLGPPPTDTAAVVLDRPTVRAGVMGARWLWTRERSQRR
ncbi:helix-turn-helix domain-containing protein [Streptomyces sp. NPDC003996]